MQRDCVVCGGTFVFRPARAKVAKFCSVPCRVANQRANAFADTPERQKDLRARSATAQKRYRQRHYARSRESDKRWRVANRTKASAAATAWRRKNIVRALVTEAKARSKKRGVEFSIDWKDVPPMGEVCPLLGHPFSGHRSGRSPHSPSLDRIDPRLGYVKGNVWIVGYRANLLKNDGTAEEHEAIALAMRSARAARTVTPDDLVGYGSP